VPQWNCACQNCEVARAGIVPARTQSCVAVSSGGESWFLINASPDLAAQINAFPALHPHPPHLRQCRIAGVLLTNADLDHVLGLLLLREGSALNIHATDAVRETLFASGIEHLLTAFCAVSWSEPYVHFAELNAADGTASGLSARAILLPGSPPPFLKKSAHPTGHSVAYQIEDRKTGTRLLVAPDVSAITPELSHALANSDIILFDGTFWSSDELQRVRPGARRSEEMGHLPIRGGSLAPLRALPAKRKAYFHINNTNPILIPGSPERAEVEAAGMIVGYDGLEFAL
jgi:pyrroloquinoline quinone biosynthesis protein B